ncbi:MAG: VOC family protein [Gammaproteobacteria bacterium]|nr:VOC family protein [Gammaproteobacteria bacterium]
MINDFLVVVMTKNLSQQLAFYQDVLGLEKIFENNDNSRTTGVGRGERIFVVLREDTSEESHHLTEHKGPQILTFKCQGNITEMQEKITQAGFNIRHTLELPQYHSTYLFIEDFDGNELCLDFHVAE